jgi:hypothetical protein
MMFRFVLGVSILLIPNNTYTCGKMFKIATIEGR